MPPQDQSRSPWASERSSPRSCIAPADTSSTGRSPEMPKRHNSRRSQTSAVSVRVPPGCGRVRLSTSAVFSVWIAAKDSALTRNVRRRMPASVAEISEARSTWLGWWYLSTTARKVPSSSLATVPKVSRAWPAARCAAARPIAPTGSSPVWRPVAPRRWPRVGRSRPAAGRRRACGRTSAGRSVGTPSPCTCASPPATKCATCSVAQWAGGAFARTAAPVARAASRSS